jgi:hypothetical protein
MASYLMFAPVRIIILRVVKNCSLINTAIEQGHLENGAGLQSPGWTLIRITGDRYRKFGEEL